MSAYCLCGSGLDLQVCCLPYLKNSSKAPTALALMRSRYSAYVAKDIEYLLQTWHPDSHAQHYRADIAQSCDNTQWLGLKIINTDQGRTMNEAFVEFMAHFIDSQTGKTHCIYERSRFLYQAGCWYYVDGTKPLIKRNDPCPFGSNKKYKKCCGLS